MKNKLTSFFTRAFTSSPFTVFMYYGIVLLILAGIVVGIRYVVNDIIEYVPPKPLQAWTFEDHSWITFNKGGLYHNPDCPCKKLTEAQPQKESRHGSDRENN